MYILMIYHIEIMQYIYFWRSAYILFALFCTAVK